MPLKFDVLIGALAGAVIEAQHQVQQAHLGDLSNYFIQEKEKIVPKTVILQIPRVSPETGLQELKPVSVPLITLVKPGQMSIQEMQVSMQVDMNEVAKEALRQTKLSIKKTGAPPYEWKPQDYSAVIDASTTTGKKPGAVGLAQVTLKVTAEETPEGLARLLDHLNKCL